MTERVVAPAAAVVWPAVMTSLFLSAAAVYLHFVLAGIDWGALDRQLGCLSPVARGQVEGALMGMRGFRFLGIAAAGVAVWGLRAPPRQAPAFALAVAIAVVTFTFGG